jgi:hypothetical protein
MWVVGGLMPSLVMTEASCVDELVAVSLAGSGDEAGETGETMVSRIGVLTSCF